MISEDYVSYEIAKLLKEKGFDEPTIFVYYDFLPSSLCFQKERCCKGALDLFYYDETTQVNNTFHNSMPIPRYIAGGVYSAPTQQMTMKWLRELGIVITIQTKYPTNPELCKIQYSFLIEDYRPERDLQKEHGKYYTGYSSTASMDDFLAENNLLFDDLGFGKFKLYEEACEVAIKYCLINLIKL